MFKATLAVLGATLSFAPALAHADAGATLTIDSPQRLADCHVFDYAPGPVINDRSQWLAIASILCTKSQWPNISLRVCTQRNTAGRWRDVGCRTASKPTGQMHYLITDGTMFTPVAGGFYRAFLRVRVGHQSGTFIGPLTVARRS